MACVPQRCWNGFCLKKSVTDLLSDAYHKMCANSRNDKYFAMNSLW